MSFSLPPSGGEGDWPARPSQSSQPAQPSQPSYPPYQPYPPSVPPAQPGQPPYGYPGPTTVPIYGAPYNQPPQVPQAPVQVPQPPQKRKVTTRATALGCATLIVACIACGWLVSANANNGGDTSASATATTAQPAHTPKPQATATPDVTAYLALVQSDVDTLSGDFSAVGSDCGNVSDGDFSVCRADLVTFRNDVESFQRDLNATAVPTCLKTEDQHLRTALQDYKTGADQAIAGIDDNSTSELSTGVTLITNGNNEITQATNAAKASHC